MLIRDVIEPNNIFKAKMKDIDVVDKIEVEKYHKKFVVKGVVPVPPNSYSDTA